MSKSRLINVRGTLENDDPFFRYKMEEVMIIQEGVKYAFINIEQIAGALSREPKEIVSFLQKHFGAQFQLKGNKVLTSKNDLTKSSLQNAIYEYIENNVLCRTCRNPETKKIIEKKQIYLACEACSAKILF
jgi:translation initiation factor 2 beta subunit (eIF-2beta)/eIF-5